MCVFGQRLWINPKTANKGCVTLKKHLSKATEELWKLKYFTMQKYNLKKIPKETKILQDIITL
jgi:hypothetical protein